MKTKITSKLVTMCVALALMFFIIPYWGFGQSLRSNPELCDISKGCDEPLVFDLLAGQTILAGQLIVNNDNDSLYVTYLSNDIWNLNAVHLYIGNLEGVPVNKKGNPMPGQFPFQEVFASPVSCFQFAFDRSLFESDDLVIFAQASVSDGQNSHTAWSDGEDFGSDRWCSYSVYKTQMCIRTQVSESSCGTIASLNQLLYCDPVDGATDYMWNWNDGHGFDQSVTRNAPYNDFKAKLVPGILTDNTYSVSVRAKVNGVWGSFGSSCNIFIPKVSTKVIDEDCGITVTNINELIYCDPVEGAQNYVWRFFDENRFNVEVSRNAVYNNFKLSMVPGIQPGTTYNVQVKVLVDNIMSEYGATCNISTPSVEGTSLASKWCNKTLSTLYQTIQCNPVLSAEDYEWKFINVSDQFIFIKRRGNSNYDFSTKWIPELAYCQTWEVSVRAKAGGLWGEFSNICTINTPDICTARMTSNDNSDPSLLNNEFATMLLYPNPSDGEQIKLELNGIDDETVAIINIYDIYGKQVYRQQLNNSYNGQTITLNNNGELAKGIYLIDVDLNGSRLNEKLIIK